MPRLEPYDAVLLLSFGGPEGPQDVMPFLDNVTRGRGVPRERLLEVAEHYDAVGGKSPINDQNRALLAALRQEIASRELDLPIAWGNRNWQPFVVEALRDLHAVGARRVVAITTSAYSSYSGCRQYREDIAAAVIELAAQGRELEVDRIRAYYDHPGYVGPMADAVADALSTLDDAQQDGARLVFVTHSIPVAMAEAAGPSGHAYVTQHEDLAAEIARRVQERTGREQLWDLVYCSRSGSPQQPWLEPDVNDHLRSLAASAAPAVVLAPIGFVSDHMEVVHDLDTEAAATARELGLTMRRAATVGTSPAFVSALVDLVQERAAEAVSSDPERPTVGAYAAWPSTCAAGCCPNPRGDRPAACGVDWAGARAAASAPVAEPAR